MTLPPAASLHHGAESFYQRWQQLNDWLVQHHELWQPSPFTDPDPAWSRKLPALAERLAKLSDADCQQMDDDPGALAVLVESELPSLQAYEALTQVPALSSRQPEYCTLPESRATDMPGRKRLQSGAFAAAIRPLKQDVLDWCCGKGHLARTLAPLCDGDVSGFEWNPALVDDGNRLAGKFGDCVSLQCQDVMDDGLVMPSAGHGVALHACGDLHRRLMQRGADGGLSRLSFSPCCYHLSDTPDYRPLSQRGRTWKNMLELSRDDLRLAVQETVTAPQRVRRQTRQISSWRLGFDGLQRQLRGVDAYLPVPSHPPALVSGDFAGFCRWAAAKKGLDLPRETDFDRWQGHGEQRLQQVRRHELVRHLFRRPLELWLVLDYGLFLEEQGFSVHLGTFCERQLTPRNLLIDAVRMAGH
ncbi:methyltransferase [Marinobacter orientalis]|uniref:Methyltransferase n=1 Tax=Marinobacter orientalis TaxID=1928859 RepID=A0A7Y0NJW4_9GAMM|nr:methyltransferase [Marinobacter orientalis]NMT62538.1 methyltransferase [Marinobacter orientalis]TGX51233.1 methyltransferase [Marinobacter orientalis]